MTTKNLSTTSFDTIVDCFLKSFENYFVKMPTDRNYYRERWKASKVDFNLSYGMFDDEKLVGFILHAIDKRSGVLTAYNAGTGVIPEHRGKKIVKSIYGYALNELKQNGIEKSVLEVITENEKAIRAYKGIGFEIRKRYKCYAGNVKIENPDLFELKEIALQNIDWEKLPNQEFCSWDFQKETILEASYTFYQVLNDKEPESFFIISPKNQLAQLDLLNNENKGWKRLFSAIKQVAEKVRIINVDDRLKDKIESLTLFGLENTVDQYEMELKIDKK